MRRSTTATVLLLLAGCTGQAPATPTLPATQAPPAALAAPAAQVAPAGPTRTDFLNAPSPEPSPTGVGKWQQVNARGQAAASSGVAANAVDGDRQTEWNPRSPIAPGAPQWLAVPLKAPAAHTLAVAWHGHALHYQNYDYGRPRTYDLQTSADSSDGSDGTWVTARTVTDNMVRSRMDLIDAPGARWVRLKFLTAWGGTMENEPFLREVMVFEERTAGAPDVLAVFGDSTTSVGLDPGQPEFFGPAIAALHQGREPFLLSAGTGGDESGNAHDRLAVGLATIPRGSVVGLCYGSNDAKRAVPIAEFQRNMQAAIEQIRTQGDVPIVAVLPWSLNGAIADYAAACRDLSKANDLPPGPDFYTYFKDHQDQLEVDRVHPNVAGIQAMQRLWASACEFRYAND